MAEPAVPGRPEGQLPIPLAPWSAAREPGGSGAELLGWNGEIAFCRRDRGYFATLSGQFRAELHTRTTASLQRAPVVRSNTVREQFRVLIPFEPVFEGNRATMRANGAIRIEAPTHGALGPMWRNWKSSLATALRRGSPPRTTLPAAAEPRNLEAMRAAWISAAPRC